MVYSKPTNLKLNSKKTYSQKAFSIIRSSFFRPNILKKYPLFYGLHRGVDGALLGVIVSCAFMTSLALHSQHLWTLNFSRLQLTRDLIHRIEESTALLETYFLKTSSSPNRMVHTKSAHLLYLDKPQKENTFFRDLWRNLKNKAALISYPVANGY